MSAPDERESFSERFVNAVIDKGLVWLLVGSIVLAVVVGVVQIGLAQ